MKRSLKREMIHSYTFWIVFKLLMLWFYLKLFSPVNSQTEKELFLLVLRSDSDIYHLLSDVISQDLSERKVCASAMFFSVALFADRCSCPGCMFYNSPVSTTSTSD